MMEQIKQIVFCEIKDCKDNDRGYCTKHSIKININGSCVSCERHQR